MCGKRPNLMMTIHDHAMAYCNGTKEERRDKWRDCIKAINKKFSAIRKEHK